jgi:hypothetical protein
MAVRMIMRAVVVLFAALAQLPSGEASVRTAGPSYVGAIAHCLTHTDFENDHERPAHHCTHLVRSRIASHGQKAGAEDVPERGNWRLWTFSPELLVDRQRANSESRACFTAVDFKKVFAITRRMHP